ncbi:class I adenylate-forming enzyme family protein [Streptomyces sp. TLI_185]|uniref:class I adenylate-forming enzyme family protein n=1 Tax=Streptomyces sp. TLI_185 TaxID=2485151 RepID=UPI000F4DE85A|nr:AMP-binding protein [Streptomyces sp. TLI_185]RPF31783.1 acyl-CoA synthetase (AMP-forming)/AMP-acid ligase II [Streptomyces sp. TLI_185]
MHIAELPDLRARQDTDGPCITDDVSTLDNTAFLRRIRQAAAALRSRGLGRGDVVALLLPNTVDFVVVLFAAWRLGAAVTPVNPALTEPEVRYQLGDADATVVVTAEPSPLTGAVTVAELAAGPEDTAAPETDADALALLIYTSGSTGRPKGVMLDHANLAAMAGMMIGAARLSETDHSLLILPLFHVNGIVVGVLSPLLAGGQVTVAGRFRAETFFDQVATVRPTCFSAVPAIYSMLTELPDRTLPDTSSVRFAACGAAPMPAALIERFERRYRIPILEGYGLSEGTCASTTNPLDGPRKPGTVGLPLPGQQVAVMDPQGRIMPAGVTGEVVVRGPNVMRGYLGRPEETARTVVGGWLHTGDVGRLDEDGYLVLVDRIKDMIIRGGENIYPKEIETVLGDHPDVLEAAVVGAADERLGEVPVAFVALRTDATADPGDLLEHCRTRLARFKVPTGITLVDRLPRNPVGKTDKPALRARTADVTTAFTTAG